MTDFIVTTEECDRSPFDQVRRLDKNNIEFWLARDLMGLLSYDKWQHFNKNIKKASSSCSNAGNPVTEHFLPALVNSGKAGRKGEDWKLSRYACYLISMNCDPDKPAVAAAQSYFAVKTREAEVRVPRLEQELELQGLKNKELELQLQVTQSQLQLGQFRHYVSTSLPEPTQQKILGYQVVEKTEYRDRIIQDDDVINDGSTVLKNELCRRYSLLNQKGKPDYKRLNQYLDKLPEEAFVPAVTLQEHKHLLREWIECLDVVVENSTRQIWMGE